MPKVKQPTTVKENSRTLAEQLEAFDKRAETESIDEVRVIAEKESEQAEREARETKMEATVKDPNAAFYDSLFEKWDEKSDIPKDFQIDVPVDSLESCVGYSSLFRQMHKAFVRQVAFYKTSAGGSLSVEDARAKAFHACTSKEEAKEHFKEIMELPIDLLNFVDLMKLQNEAPRVAEWLWEQTKREGRKEFESGHLAANITFPEGYMKQVWNIARYLGVRESFIDEWGPKGGIEVAMIDMLAEAYFQWQYWLEQTVRRSQTKEQLEHPEYSRWKACLQRENKWYERDEGYWVRPLVSEERALEHAVQMADRFNRIFMRTLRQLRDLRRYTPLTINNPNQVNIATDGGKQINISDSSE